MAFYGTDIDDYQSNNANLNQYGGDGNDRLIKSNGNFIVEGGYGNDFLWQNGNFYMDAHGGKGYDWLLITTGSNTPSFLYGEEGGDVIQGGIGGDYIDGGQDGDALYGNDGIDTIYGGDGDDSNLASITAGATNYAGWYTISPGGLYGGAGADYLDGGRGNDYLDGGIGADRMIGGEGNDTMVVSEAADYIVEGVGQGNLDVVLTTVGYGLGTGVEVERLSAFDTAQNVNYNLFGNEFAQEIFGNAGKNRINGLGGADVIKGFAGDDTFVYSSSAYSGVGAAHDIIQDFEDYGDNDTIDLSGFAGTLTFRGTGAIGSINQVHIEQTGSHVLIQINAYGDLAPDVEILLANTSLANVTASDFLL